MTVDHINNVEGKYIEAPGARDLLKQVLVGPKEGWDGWVMRRVTVGINGGAPRHRHPWPHINYVLSGRGKLFLEGKEYILESGSFDYVPTDAEHEFTAIGDDEFIIICIVPVNGEEEYFSK